MSEIAVIGAGIGGLLAAARLSNDFEVEIFERLPIIGGRFTNLPYKGFQLSSGALHMVPHGATGPFGLALKQIRADVDIVRSEPDAVVRMEDGSDEKFREIPQALNMGRLEIAMYVAKILFAGNRTNIVDIFSRRPRLVSILEAFSGWALSLSLSQIPASELFAIYRSIQKYGTPGIPIGGCKGIIDAISQTFQGVLHTSSEVTRIIVRNNKIIGIKARGELIRVEHVISDIGPDATNRLLGIESTLEKPSTGIKISVSSKEKLIEHTGVLLTPFTRRIKGLNQVTNADPNLSPPGKHLIMSHQPIQSHNLNAEIYLGLKDLNDLFQNKFDVLLVQCYRNGWPVNRMGSGLDAVNLTPYKNLYLVGDGAKVKGGIEVEGVAMGVEKVVATLMK